MRISLGFMSRLIPVQILGRHGSYSPTQLGPSKSACSCTSNYLAKADARGDTIVEVAAQKFLQLGWDEARRCSAVNIVLLAGTYMQQTFLLVHLHAKKRESHLNFT